MVKKKYLIIILVTLALVLCLAFAIIFHKNRSYIEKPIDYLVEAINDKDINELPKAFHEYCSLYIEQSISESDFNTYIDNVKKEVGDDYKVTYQVIDTEKLSDDETKYYETSAQHIYSEYPYLSNGGELKFESIYKITAYFTIKGDREHSGNVKFLIVKIDKKYYFLHTANQLMSMFIDFYP